ncbi:glycosyltransferase [Fundidesulfovibrio agrisoli]|uniref:glycosyltransferase n=1 Tax=Fundidesulfovibrio agrisoli TaxID=2922717 RepID=UPI001FADE62B|nr:glycosyltransferase [Fundidesulfovibrio agrisoli]
MRPVKTVLLLQDFHLGGTQRHALELAKRLDPARFQTEIWTLMGGDAFLPKAREYGLTVRMLAGGGAVGPAGLWSLWRGLSRFRPDALMALTVVPNIWGRVLGRLARVPAVVANCRGGDDLWRQHEGLLRNLAHHHICNARALKAALTERYGLPPERVDVIPTGVDTDFFLPAPKLRQEPPVILCLARLAPVKDHETLIRAFEILQPGHPEARLRLVGDGELREKLAARIAASPAAASMELLPGVSDPRPHYGAASVVALSSANEGMPNVLLEGMSMGLPAVGTDVGGVGEVIRHGRTGFVVPKRDSEALAGALSTLLDDAGLRERMGEEGRRTALEEHSLGSVAERHAAIIEGLVRARR